MSAALTILSTSIRQDTDGRYCLNDCHKAAGGDAGKRPGEWLRNAQTKALVAEIEGDAGIPAGPVSTVNDGKNNGTYVAKELVYAYAMWISPAFHLTVIRAFDAMVTGTAQPNTATLSREQEIAITALRADIQRASLQMNRLVDTTVLEIMGVTKSDRKRRPRTELTSIQHANGMFRSLLSFNKATGLDRNQAILAANAAVKRETGIDLMAISGTTHLTAIETDQLLTPTAIGQRCNKLGAQAINRALRAMGYQTKEKVGHDEVWLPTKAGEPFAVMQDTGKAHTDGTPVRQLKWRANVVARVQEWLASAPGGEAPFARTPEAVS